MKKKLIIAVVVVLVVGGIGLFLWSRAHKDLYADLLCPSQYPTTQAAEASFQEFTNRFYATNPNATLQDLLQARLQFYRDHHCTEKLQKYQEYENGEVSTSTKAVINEAIQSAINR